MVEGISIRIKITKSLYASPVRSSAANDTPKYTKPNANLNIWISLRDFISEVRKLRRGYTYVLTVFD